VSFVTVARFARSTAFAAALLVLCAAPTAYAQVQVVPDLPTVEGPITGPGPMHPGIRPGPEGTNLADFDYFDEEYFVSGFTVDPANPTSGVRTPYKTRLLIRKPANPQKFSGMLVGEPTHRGGNGLICQYARFGIGQRGHACMTVAARRINLTNPLTAGAGLYEFNIGRYGSLQVTDAQTNQIIAQVGRLLRENPVGGPMGEYAVRTLILSGTSDSSGATRTYMSSGPMLDHSELRMPDGGPIYQGFLVTAILGSGLVPTIADAPVIQMPTQSELHSTNGFRRPDSDAPSNRFRSYEMSGMSHNDARENPAFFDCTT
jgi:alpha/beta hydrolase family protein